MALCRRDFLAGLGAAPVRPIDVIESRDHQDVIFAPVPEPSSIALMLSGLVVAGGIARRRGRKGGEPIRQTACRAPARNLLHTTP